MDIITKSYFDEFKKLYGYESLAESDAFELFAIYCVASKYIKSETLSKDILEDIKIGNGNDWGIDGFIIIANGKIVTSKKVVDDLLAVNDNIAVQVVLIQAKTSSNFDVSELCMALNGIEYLMKDVLGEETLPKSNEDLTVYRNLLKYIYSHSSDFTDNLNPKLYGYYICCGNYAGQEDFESPKRKTIAFVDQTDLTQSFEYLFVDRKGIVNYYKDTKSKLEAVVNIEQKLTLPKVNGISDAYLCILPFKELNKLFVSDNKIIQEVFYDNVRSYQGMNQVNRSITESLKHGNIDLFTAMNNGVTIIAKKIKPTGHDIRLVDYQVVNGCQTCHVLFQNRHLSGIDNLKVAVKLIASEDKEIRDKIIVGNNSQTEVKREQLVSLLDSQRYIEDYYNAQNKYEKLYYERRSKQYKNDDIKVPLNKVITIPTQILAFVSMFMSAPDKVSGYYGSIVAEFEKNGKKVFTTETNPAYYYTCALASYKMTEMFSNGVLERKYKKIKFHMLLAFRLMCESMSLPAFNSNKSQLYCDHLCDILCNEERCKIGFIAAAKLVDTALNRKPNDSDRMKASFTRKIMELAARANQINHNKKVNKEKFGESLGDGE